MAFEAITTQEALDKAISDYVAANYGDYEDNKAKAALYESEKSANEANAGKLADYEETIGELNGKIKGYETNALKQSIAHELGLPFEMHTRLSGETEDEIRKDAAALSKLFKSQYSAPPLRDTEGKVDEKTAALKGLADKLISRGG